MKKREKDIIEELRLYIKSLDTNYVQTAFTFFNKICKLTNKYFTGTRFGFR